MATMKALTPDEVLKVLKLAASESKRDHAMILLTFRHGLRSSEVCRLRLDDVDLKNWEVTITRLKGSLKTTQALADEQGKPLLSERKVLREWLAERQQRAGAQTSPWLFLGQRPGKHGGVGRGQFFRIFQSLAIRAGLPKEKRHPHCLKHSLGFALVAANVNLATIKQRLGHKSIASTAIYAQATDEQADRAAAETFAKLF